MATRDEPRDEEPYRLLVKEYGFPGRRSSLAAISDEGSARESLPSGEDFTNPSCCTEWLRGVGWLLRYKVFVLALCVMATLYDITSLSLLLMRHPALPHNATDFMHHRPFDFINYELYLAYSFTLYTAGLACVTVALFSPVPRPSCTLFAMMLVVVFGCPVALAQLIGKDACGSDGRYCTVGVAQLPLILYAALSFMYLLCMAAGEEETGPEISDSDESRRTTSIDESRRTTSDESRRRTLWRLTESRRVSALAAVTTAEARAVASELNEAGLVEADPTSRKFKRWLKTEVLVANLSLPWDWTPWRTEVPSGRVAWRHWWVAIACTACVSVALALTQLIVLWYGENRSIADGLGRGNNSWWVPGFIAVLLSSLNFVCKGLALEMCGPFQHVDPVLAGFHYEVVVVWFMEIVYFTAYRGLFSDVASWHQVAALLVFRAGYTVCIHVVRFTRPIFRLEWWARQKAHALTGRFIPGGALTEEEARVTLLERSILFYGVTLTCDVIVAMTMLTVTILILWGPLHSALCTGCDQIQAARPDLWQEEKDALLYLFVSMVCDNATSGVVLYFFHSVHQLACGRLWARCFMATPLQIVFITVMSLQGLSCTTTMALFSFAGRPDQH